MIINAYLGRKLLETKNYTKRHQENYPFDLKVITKILKFKQRFFGYVIMILSNEADIYTVLPESLQWRNFTICFVTILPWKVQPYK